MTPHQISIQRHLTICPTELFTTVTFRRAGAREARLPIPARPAARPPSVARPAESERSRVHVRARVLAVSGELRASPVPHARALPASAARRLDRAFCRWQHERLLFQLVVPERYQRQRQLAQRCHRLALPLRRHQRQRHRALRGANFGNNALLYSCTNTNTYPFFLFISFLTKWSASLTQIKSSLQEVEDGFKLYVSTIPWSNIAKLSFKVFILLSHFNKFFLQVLIVIESNLIRIRYNTQVYISAVQYYSNTDIK